MNEWIDFGALAKVVIGGLICGAGLPALFALGLRALHMGAPAPVLAGGVDGSDDGPAGDDLVGGSPLGVAIAAICFLVVLGAVAWGIYLIAAA